MLKLYYAPGACSLSPHLALRESGVPFTLERVDFKAGKRLPDGTPFTAINPKGYVPALGLADGQLLTEGVAIVQYIADLNPASRLAPPPASFARVRLQEWLNFIATELHKGLSPLFAPQASDEYKQAVKERVATRLAFVTSGLGDKPFLLGEDFSIADGYMLYVLRAWQRFAQGQLVPAMAAYQGRIVARPAVRAALDAEGLS